ncbi:MAG: oligoendopeptidase F [candidate division Zixibacteria bacterium]|nr:oligoendopeptidase F [candidate division Zixibacteria bacterium]
MTLSNSQKIITVLMAFILIMVLVPTGTAQEDGAIPQRSDIDDRYKWKLEDIYPNTAAWEKDYEIFKASIPLFEQFQGKLGESAETLLACLKLRDSIDIIGDNLYVYSYMKRDEDTRISDYQEMADRIVSLYAQYNSATAFIQPEILTIDNTVLQSFINSNEELSVYSHYLNEIIRSKEHILSEKEEAILAIAAPFARSPQDIFSMIDDADIKYGKVFDEDSNEVELTNQRYVRMLRSNDRRVRRDASDTYNEAYLDYKNTLAACLAASVKKDVFFAQARKYNSCLEMSLFGDDIPTDVFTNLIKAVNDNLAPMHKWASLRKRILNVDTMQTYDMIVPLVAPQTREYAYDDAVKIVTEALKPLGEQYLKDFKKGLVSGWIDVYETEGKRSGGYQWGTYDTHPFILLNWSNNIDNVFTLAHEMGHSMHSFYTRQEEPYIYGYNPLFTAEVASICNEALLMDYLLKKARDKDEKIYLLTTYIEKIIGTFYTQVMFSEFEQQIHERIESGQAISADYLQATYRGIYEKYWGPDLFIAENRDLGGMRISHFYRQFYVYKYATSFTAALDIAQRILNKEKDALKGYQEFLGIGASKPPIDIVKVAGVDLTKPDPANATIKLFGELVDEVERLLDES